ncbi:MAG: hypothetical protein ACO39S_12255 [Steroidobacteraceae bacterium]
MKRILAGGMVGLLAWAAVAGAADYDLLLKGGTVYDGLGGDGRVLDVAIRDDRIAALLEPGAVADAARVIDVTGLAVAPGFINVLSWANESLLVDGRGMSDLLQGVTLEIFGEGWSMGPWNEAMKAEVLKNQGDLRFDIEWTTLGEYLEHLERRGVSPNVASFVGATTVRIHELGEVDRPPTPEELARMQELVRQGMREGALGVGSSLIYAPAFYADTDELIALTRAAGELGGGYISHMRNESNQLLEAIDELLTIGREAGVHAEAYHLKAAGEGNWPKMKQAIERIQAARDAGQSVTADMYTYVAGATGLDAAMPPWVQEGGNDAWVERLKDPEIRARVIEEMRSPPVGWDNLYRQAGSPERLLLIGFRNEQLKPLTGRTLAEVAAERGTSPEDTIIDLVIEDHSRVATAYFLMSEDNVRLGVSQPWVSFGSDAAALAPEGAFLASSTHPRAYGNFARLLGKYVREEGLMSLGEAVRRLTRLPAENWKLKDRGCIDPGCYADVAVFDPATVADRATFAEPMQYAVGMVHVLVNGQEVVADGQHTGAKPGRVVRGPGYRPEARLSSEGRRGSGVDIAAGPDGTAWLLWTEKGEAQAGRGHASSDDLFLAAWPADAAAPGGAIRVNSRPGEVKSSALSKAQVEVDEYGNVHVLYGANGNSPVTGKAVINVHYTRMEDGGFAAPQVVNAPAGNDNSATSHSDVSASATFAALASAGAGQLHALWLDTRLVDHTEAPGHLFAASSDDGGKTWSTDRPLFDAVCPCCQPVVAVGSGRVWMSSRQVDGSGHRDPAIRVFDARLEPLSEPVRVSEGRWQIEGCPLKATGLAVDGEAAWAAWYGQAESPAGAWIARSAGVGQPFTDARPLHPEAAVSDAPVVVAREGAVWVAWHAKEGEEARRVYLSHRRAGGEFSQPVAISPAEVTASYPALALAGEDLVIAWQQGEAIVATRLPAALP